MGKWLHFSKWGFAAIGKKLEKQFETFFLTCKKTFLFLPFLQMFWLIWIVHILKFLNILLILLEVQKVAFRAFTYQPDTLYFYLSCSGVIGFNLGWSFLISAYSKVVTFSAPRCISMASIHGRILPITKTCLSLISKKNQ